MTLVVLEWGTAASDTVQLSYLRESIPGGLRWVMTSNCSSASAAVAVWFPSHNHG